MSDLNSDFVAFLEKLDTIDPDIAHEIAFKITETSSKNGFYFSNEASHALRVIFAEIRSGV